MRLKADLTLLLVAVIWGTSFAAQRVASEYIGPFLFNGARFLLGALVLLPLIKFKLKLDRKAILWVLLAGAMICAASVLQQAGLKWTTAGNAGFITGLYVVIVPVIMLILWKQKTNILTWLAILMAAAGMFLLSAGTTFSLAPGDSLELIGAFFWAAHVVIVGKAMATTDTLHFAIGQYLVAGVINTIIGLIFESQTIPGLIPGWWTVAYIGIFSVAVGYTLQAKAQKHAPAADAALILSLESVFSAVFGFIFLHEILSPIQLTGAALMMTAIFISQFGPNIIELIRKKIPGFNKD